MNDFERGRIEVLSIAQSWTFVNSQGLQPVIAMKRGLVVGWPQTFTNAREPRQSAPKPV
jgi:hypothetical protein